MYEEITLNVANKKQIERLTRGTAIPDSDVKIKIFNPEKKEFKAIINGYDVILTPKEQACGCPDYIYKGHPDTEEHIGLCKHLTKGVLYYNTKINELNETEVYEHEF